jgi:hypothetical protein
VLDEDHILAENPRARTRSEILKVRLTDARRLSLDNENFEQPSAELIRKIHPGDFVKLARNHERFWVKVTGFEGRKYHGQVANVLNRSDELQLGDRIYFERKNIYDILQN